MTVFDVSRLPEVDQQQIKRGRCPWCLERLFDNGKEDSCHDCGDVFVGSLTIQD